MEKEATRKGLILNPVTIPLLIALIFLFGEVRPRFRHWQKQRYEANEKQFLHEIGVRRSPQADLIYGMVYSCYHSVTVSDPTEPPSICANATTGYLVSAYPQKEQQEMQKLIAAMESDSY